MQHAGTHTSCRSANTVNRLKLHTQGKVNNSTSKSNSSSSNDVLKALDTLARCLEERRQSRQKWTERLADGAYASLPQHMKPLRPALWNSTTTAAIASSSASNGSSSGGSASLPHDLSGTVAALRAR
jgi:FTO C-terminal domain